MFFILPRKYEGYEYVQLIWTNVHINSMGSLLVSGWTPFCFQNCLNSSWYRFNNELKAFGPYSHDYVTQSTSTTSLLYWIEIYLLWRTFEYSALAVMFEKPAWHDVSFVTGCCVCPPAGCCHQLTFKWCSVGTKGSKVCHHQHLHQPKLSIQGRTDSCFWLVYSKFWPVYVVLLLRLMNLNPCT